MHSKFLSAAIVVILVSVWSAAQTHGPMQPGAPGFASSSAGAPMSEPENGTVEKDSYINKYFDLSLALLPDWREDFSGPNPSITGYYVLETLRPKGELTGTLLITAQDTFFTSENNSLELLQRNQKQAILSTLSIEAPPRPVKLADREFSRLDYSGAGLYHAIFATDVRCHVISFEATSRDPGVLEKLFQSMDKMSLPLISNPAPANGQVPRCVKGYATGTNVIHKVDPMQVGPKFTRVPVRIIIDAQGKVKHIHIINAVPDQAASIQAALEQWVFKPYIENGTAVEVETGLLFEFSGNSKTPNGLQEVKNEVLQ